MSHEHPSIALKVEGEYARRQGNARARGKWPQTSTIVFAASVELCRARPLHGVQTQRGAWVLTLGQGTLRLLPTAESTWTVVQVLRGEAPHRRELKHLTY